MIPWRPGGNTIAFGGDYNPEQWPREVWAEDVALMQEAGVNLVSIGIFSWALLERRPGEFDFAWLDEVIALLHDGGIAINLGTPTASPPPWFYATHPEARVVTKDGVALGVGSRGAAAPSSPAYRAACARITTAIAQRYGSHPAVAMWHVHNEYGAPVAEDYSVSATQAFRAWLESKYRTIDRLNRAWGTAFWGQNYEEWSHIDVPRATASMGNPAQLLDFARFTDLQLLECYIAERDIIRLYSDRPITTNFMANQCLTTDLWRWSEEVDVVANDHYLTAADPRGEIGLAFAADLTRSVADGLPWMLMEHSTSAVNWQPRNVAKRPGEMARNALAHVARGADAVMFFQWRASRAGAERFHSAMIPHSGTESRVWREVEQLGSTLSGLGELAGSRVRADVALLWDTESFWAQDMDWQPSVDLNHRERMRAFYEALWVDGVTIDFAHPSHDLSKYALIVAPASYLLTTESADNLRRYVQDGGVLVVSCFSGAVDEDSAVHEGGFLAPLADVLGVQVEEYLPLREGDEARVEWLAATDSPLVEMTHRVWQEDLVVRGAEVRARYLSGPAAGGAAITRNAFGDGTAWYVSVPLTIDDLRHVLAAARAEAGLEVTAHREQMEIVTREGVTSAFTVMINHGDSPAPSSVAGFDLIAGSALRAGDAIPGGSVAVVRTAPHASVPVNPAFATARSGADTIESRNDPV